MEYTNVKAIFFSPTNTSFQIAQAVSESIGKEVSDSINMTFPIEDENISSDTFAVIAVPVYGGRVAPLALSRLKHIKGNNTPCVIIVVYGNRDYDDALLELRNEVKKLGFVPIAAGAFIGEHSYSREKYPIAKGRPDANDLEMAKHFGKEIGEKLASVKSIDDIPDIEVKGDYPYKPYNPSPATPQTIEDLCTQCGTCIELCPAECIRLDEEIVSDPNLCIKCCACVKKCPNQARVFETPYSELLSLKCALPKDNEMKFFQ